MILTDFSAVSIAATINSAMREKIALDDNVIRHIVFSTFKNVHKALGAEYGEHLLCCDSRSWRKDSFEFYKANRKKAKKEQNAIDWEMIYKVMDDIRESFDKYFPFHVIKTPGLEADDIIAAFAKKATEPTVIVSKDHDFFQLHNRFVKQWDFSKKSYIEVDDPAEIRLLHIIGGDAGDGVPNILSDDDTFVIEGKRQKRMTKGRVKECLAWAQNEFEDAPAELKRNWDRNKLMVDLTDPVPAAMDSVYKYITQEKKVVTQNDTASYLAKNKMVVLLGKISDFYKGHNNKSVEKGPGPLSNFM